MIDRPGVIDLRDLRERTTSSSRWIERFVALAALVVDAEAAPLRQFHASRVVLAIVPRDADGPWMLERARAVASSVVGSAGRLWKRMGSTGART